jgi:hypothetical protein
MKHRCLLTDWGLGAIRNRLLSPLSTYMYRALSAAFTTPQYIFSGS